MFFSLIFKMESLQVRLKKMEKTTANEKKVRIRSPQNCSTTIRLRCVGQNPSMTGFTNVGLHRL
jgi:hypothetical protein